MEYFVKHPAGESVRIYTDETIESLIANADVNKGGNGLVPVKDKEGNLKGYVGIHFLLTSVITIETPSNVSPDDLISLL